MKITQEQAEAIFFEEGQVYNDDKTGVIPMFDIVDEGDWQDGGKFADKYTTFSLSDDNQRFFWLQTRRSGNHWDGWEYEQFLECPEVTQVEVTTKEWRTKT